MKFCARDVKLAIFDLDGTLIDSTGMWVNIDREFFRMFDRDVPEGYAKAISHIGLAAAAAFTKKEYGIPMSEEEIKATWRRLSLEQYENHIQLKPGAKEILARFYINGIPMAVATANSEDLYLPCLKRLGIYERFSYITDADKIKESKNSSKIYDIIAENFHVSPTETVVFEDSLTAMKTARNAGYFTIGIFDDHSTHSIEEAKSSCDIFVQDFKQLLGR